MATNSVHKQEFAVRNLQTKSVTLYPTKAQVVRVINGISLKPGPNQVIVEGFTPTVDEHSIKVEGTGSATITDLSVQLVVNKEVYEDIYPEEDEDEEDDSEEEEEVEDSAELQAVKNQIEQINVEITAEREIVASATSRLDFLQKYGGSIKEDRPENVGEFLSKYQDARAKVFEDHTAAAAKIKELEKKTFTLNRKRARLERLAVKAKFKELKEKEKALKKKQRQKREKEEEKARIRAERVKFWPKKVYKVIISLDGSSGMTPASSRRASMESLVSLPSKVPEQDLKSIDGEVNLTISYITYSASWSPHYDLSLNTVTNTGVLDFSAELRNTTSETWTDAKVVLSTSQTSYQGLGDTIPLLQPWHVRLMKGAFTENGALYSQYEKDQKHKHRTELPTQMQAPRNELFGHPVVSDAIQLHMVGNSGASLFGSNGGGFGAKADGAQAKVATPLRAVHQQQQQMFQTAQENLVQSQESARRTWDSVAVPPPPPPPVAAAPVAYRRAAPSGGMAFHKRAEDLNEEAGFGGVYGGDDDDTTFTEPDPALLFEESSFEESGLTTTYDVPSLKTLAPMSSTTKHKIVRVEFRAIVFSHILIPKLKAAAFLKARLQNSSKITLLKGTAGLTLDGSFLGQSAIPRCSAGDSFSLPLGVDPTIAVTYSKPTVRRSQSGIFNKEDCEVFNRTATITNSKSAPVELLVLDQVPVSEDERLRIETVSPRGLKLGGEPVLAGVALTSATTLNDGGDGNNNKGKWGAATAFMKKGGEVNWKVRLNPQRGCKLVLEYEAIKPGGETVVGA